MTTPESSQDAYARYALGLLVVVYVLNFLDRQILSILAERIKADLGVSDAQIGFLYGTAFAVFYAIFGIPLGRLADVWVRTRLIALGLAGWSLMTALSAFAVNFTQLTAARIGVGIGEASASPAAYSLLSDLFPPARRATVLAIYSSGIYLGAGLGLFIGGLIVERWDAAYAASAAAPFGLRGWQVAFLAVGLAGLPMALWVATLREPRRGASEGLTAPAPHPAPGRAFARELAAVVPPFTVISLALSGGVGALARNLAAAAGIVATAWLLTALLGTPAQWIALGLGAYAAVSWAQGLRLRDPQAFDVIFRTPALRSAAFGFALLAFTGYGIGFWVTPWFLRERGIGEAEAGLLLGGTAAAGWLGVTLGGVWSDRWRRSAVGARCYVGIAAALLPLPFIVGMLRAESNALAFALNAGVGLLTALWIGPGATTVQDLVPARLRGTASAVYLLVVTFVGLALGPYTIGRLSVALGDLQQAMLWALVVNPIAAVLLWRASRTLPHAA